MARHNRGLGSARHRQKRKLKLPSYAAIDLGTNACRMLIGRPSDTGFAIIDSFSSIVRLGAGLADADNLQQDAMDRTVAALKVCAEKIRNRGVRRVKGVATAACRRARNGNDFIDIITDKTGLRLETIDARLEAQFTLAGCAPLLRSGYSHGLLFDIGGGSTEVMWIDCFSSQSPNLIDMISLPFGVVTLTEEYGRQIDEASRYTDIVARVQEHLASFNSTNDVSGMIIADKVQMLGTSGTMTTLGALYLGLQSYDRSRVDGLSLDLANIRTHSSRIFTMDPLARENLPCIGREHADLMLIGCAILAAITKRWPVKNVRIADRGIREGLIMAMIEEAQQSQNLMSDRPAA